MRKEKKYDEYSNIHFFPHIIHLHKGVLVYFT